VLYLTGSLPAKPELLDELKAAGVGLLVTPRNNYPTKPTDDMVVAADNGCFSSDWDADEWSQWLTGVRRDVVFATVPDVVGGHQATRQRWGQWAGYVADLGLPPAYVIQDGQPIDLVPWDEMAALFVGGSTEYKLSADARRLVAEANRRGLWTHMGRVNSLRRLHIASEWGCDSVDGTFIKFGPDVNTPRLIRYLRRVGNHRQQLTIW
jgi:hypothetical protein